MSKVVDLNFYQSSNPTNHFQKQPNSSVKLLTKYLHAQEKSFPKVVTLYQKIVTAQQQPPLKL